MARLRPFLLITTQGHWLLAWVLSAACLFPVSALSATFRFHSLDDEVIDLNQIRNPLSAFALSLISSPLMKFEDGQLKSNSAVCSYIEGFTKVRCDLREDWKWSDGTRVQAKDLIKALHQLFIKKSFHVQDFLGLKGAKEVLSGKKPLSALGVTAPQQNRLVFELTSPDSEFLYRLVSPTLLLHKNDGRVTAGPYILSEKNLQKNLILKSNAQYFVKVNRPDIEVLILESDLAALHLYQAGKLNLLRRISADQIVQFKGKPDIFRVPVYRFDYIGFGPSLNAYPDLRHGMIQSLQDSYRQFEILIESFGRPGCIGLPAVTLGAPLCYKTQPFKKASEIKIPKSRLQYHYVGYAEDIRRQAELFQSGWKKKLGLQVDLYSTEGRTLTAQLKNSPPPLFHRGVNMDRPTCSAALEIFKKDNPLNYLKISDPKYDKIVDELLQAADASVKMKLCRQGFERLLGMNRLIPLGEIHWVMAHDQKFDGFKINELQQLDASRLKAKDP